MFILILKLITTTNNLFDKIRQMLRLSAWHRVKNEIVVADFFNS